MAFTKIHTLNWPRNIGTFVCLFSIAATLIAGDSKAKHVRAYCVKEIHIKITSKNYDIKKSGTSVPGAISLRWIKNKKQERYDVCLDKDGVAIFSDFNDNIFNNLESNILHVKVGIHNNFTKSAHFHHLIELPKSFRNGNVYYCAIVDTLEYCEKCPQEIEVVP